MPALEAYRRELEYAYAPGIFPAMEVMQKRPELVRRLLLSKKVEGHTGADKLRELADRHGIRIEIADKALSRISGKENCYAAAVFEKRPSDLDKNADHIVLHHIADAGNLGTVLRTALGLGYLDIAVIRPAVDPYEPKAVRASMGALFGLRLREYPDFETYRKAYPDHAAYPFMLDGSVMLDDAVKEILRPCCLILGNEGAGLPPAFAAMGQPVRIPHSGEIDSLNLSIAAAIGMYAFRRKDD